jgi:hypothetical protein
MLPHGRREKCRPVREPCLAGWGGMVTLFA